MNLTPKQDEFVRNEKRYKVANWGRRSGKTTVFAYEALGTGLTVNNAQVTYYAQTFGDARDIAWDIFLEVFGDAVLEKNQTLLEITIRNLHGGTSKVSLKGWESVITSSKGRGIENDLLLFDEVAFCRGFMDAWKRVLRPTILTSKGRAVFGSTPNGFNDFYELSQIAQEEGEWYYSHATSYDNPHNDPAEIQKIKDEEDIDVFHQEYLADFRKLSGLVYPGFDEQKHTYIRLPELAYPDKITSADYGWSNLTVIGTIFVQQIGDKKHYYLDAELAKTEMGENDVATYVLGLEPKYHYGDPAQPNYNAAVEKKGVRVKEVIKGSDSIRNGIAKVRDVIREDRLHVNRECTNTIWEIQNYQYKKSKGDKNEPEEPVKINDHSMDMLRYAIMMEEIDTIPARKQRERKIRRAIAAKNRQSSSNSTR